MKHIFFCVLALVLLTAVSAKAQVNDAPEFLDEGSDVHEYPAVQWLKGQAVPHFDPGKIYIVELWATWCIPCLASMPHLKALNDKFKDKNVILIAQDVMEDNIEKVKEFISKKGDAYNFRIAYGGGEGSDFDKKWIKPAGVRGIPTTFVIQNNKIVWITQPSSLNEDNLQLLVDGKFTVESATALIK